MGAHDTAGLSALPSLVTVKESTLSLTTIHYKGFPGVFLNGRRKEGEEKRREDVRSRSDP